MIRDKQVERVRDLSTALFGARYRLEVCAALHARSTVTAAELLDEFSRTAEPPSQASISVELKRLCGAGLLRPIPPTAGDRHKPLAVVDSPMWKAAAELIASAQRGRVK